MKSLCTQKLVWNPKIPKSLVTFQLFLGLVNELKRLGFNSLQHNNLEMAFVKV